MKLIKEQKLYFPGVKHNSTLEGAFMWWTKRRNKHCRKFCPLCSYFYRCQEDVAREEFMEGE